MVDDYPSALWPEGAQLSLMRAALLDGPAAIAAFHEWRDGIVFDDLDPASFRLLPLLRWNLNRLGVKDPLMARIDSVVRFQMVGTTLKLDILRRLALALHGMHVPVLLLKGAAIGRQYYPHPSLRPMADCDLLIPGDKGASALERLLAAGWRVSGDDKTPHHYSSDLCHPQFDTITVELHWHSGIESTRSDDRMMWEASEETTFQNVPCRVFCPGDEIIHACRHGYNWTAEVPPMRWLADCAMILRKSGGRIDWDRLAERAAAMEQTLCVRRSLEWIRREACAPVPAEALQKLRARRARRREIRTYVLKGRPRDWGVTLLLYAAFLDRELPSRLWPLHPRRVLRYFAEQFALQERRDILRYFIYNFRQLARSRRKYRLEKLLTETAQECGMRLVSTTWPREDFTGRLENPVELCWARRKVRLEGFACAHDGGATGRMRVVHDGRVIDSMHRIYARVDIAKHLPQFTNALNSGFLITFDLPARECEVSVERRGTVDWEPLFSVRFENFQVVNGVPMLEVFPQLPQQLEFGDTGSGRFLPNGWGLPEGSFRWSDGSRAEIIFSMEEIESIDFEIQMCPLLVPARIEHQTVTLSLNGHKLLSWDLEKEVTDTYTVRFPRALLKTSNIITFDLPDATSPAALGISDDARKLAIRVAWVKFHKRKTLWRTLQR